MRHTLRSSYRLSSEASLKIALSRAGPRLAQALAPRLLLTRVDALALLRQCALASMEWPQKPPGVLVAVRVLAASPTAIVPPRPEHSPS